VTGTDAPRGALDRATLVAELDRTRRRTLGLAADLDDADLTAQHSTLMSPLVWDLAHVANYEDLWLLRAIDGRPSTDERLDDLYDAFRHPRRDRPQLPLLSPDEARRYLADTRAQVLELLATVEPRDGRLLDGWFVYGMVMQHEHQHDETILATRQLMGERATAPPALAPPVTASAGPKTPGEDVLVDGGQFVQGTDDDPWAYDNERGAHETELAPFRIDTTPVTNRAFREFVEAGGYDDERLWQPAGWAFRHEADLHHPQYWSPEGAGTWSVLRFGTRLDLVDDEPVQHVCWYEADAFARWAGRRLPTEAEWEKAATWHPVHGQRRYPWGDDAPDLSTANLGQRQLGPSLVGALPGGVSPWGCHQMIGDVWEWTASDFTPYPGFDAFPYREYSEVFWGSEYKVLRGGSWAADTLAVRGTFRNWDYPIRRQIFAGFRCARDA